MWNANQIVGTHDLLFMTLDTLRYDVACQVLQQNRLPTISKYLPNQCWEERHSPGNFTFAAHQAFFAGFLPTPATPGNHPRLFALRFPGSETTTPETCVFDSPDLIHGFEQRGYHTICIGGVGFFNQLTPLGKVLPSYFRESHWSPELGVTEPRSTEYQVDRAIESLQRLTPSQRVFLFINISALHQPNYFYLPGANEDSLETHAAALEYVDSQIGRLFDYLAKRSATLVILSSDHGTAYGEEGYRGHRLCHKVVWTVPYAEFIIGPSSM